MFIHNVLKILKISSFLNSFINLLHFMSKTTLINKIGILSVEMCKEFFHIPYINLYKIKILITYKIRLDILKYTLKQIVSSLLVSFGLRVFFD